MESLLAHVANDLAIRSEAESCLAQVLYDVEIAHHLEQKLRQSTKLGRCQDRLAVLRHQYEEKEAMWEEERRANERLGDLMVEQLVMLSAKDAADEAAKKDLERKLMVLESRTGGDSETGFSRGNDPLQTKGDVPGDMVSNDDRTGGETQVQDVAQEIMAAVVNSNDVSTADNGEESKAVSGAAALTTAVPEQEVAPLEKRKESNATAAVNSVPKSEETPAQPERNAQHNQNSEQLPLPQNLDETSLMNVFTFVDPMDIVSLAQSNRATYFKIDSLFGLGGALSENPTDDVAPVNDVENLGSGTEIDSASCAADAPPGVAPVMTSHKEQPEDGQPTTGNQQAPATEAASPIAPPTLSSTGTPAAPMSGFSNMFSRLQVGIATAAKPPDVPAGGASSSPPEPLQTHGSSTGTTTPATNATNPPVPEIKLNASMANSMASKLTPAELSVILRMREKLQRCEADSERWRLEKEDVASNLASVEAVKEFLVARAQETENKVKAQRNEIEETKRKTASDQELIAFLDARVQTSERSLGEMKAKDETMQLEAVVMKNKNKRQLQVLSDMLRFEREQMAASEKEWKAAKKVLVKEVKSCRARVLALEADQEGCERQNAQLREGLMALTHSGGSPKQKKNRRN